MDPLITLPLTAIMPEALPRDRSAADPAAMEDLVASIAANGLRQPVEVWALSTPMDGFTHGLIAGHRRLAAHHRLASLRTDGSFATIACFLRSPASLPAALAAMVEENECRAGITPWEKARLLVVTVSEGHFDTLDAAVAALHPLANATDRSRLRSLAHVVDVLDEVLTDPTAYSLRQLLRLSAALKAGFAEVILTALQQNEGRRQPEQWDLLQNILAEAERSLLDPTFDPPPPRRAKRVVRPREGLVIRREWLPNGWRLVFTGPEAKGMMIESVIGEIERMYGPG
jgi:ParB family transcriptional regulator, chromosome partitioning protein